MNPTPSIPAVVVTYHPDAGFGDRLAAIARIAAPVLVVDNSADPAARAAVSAAATRHRADYRPQAVNRGIGAALNLAFAELAAAGFSAALAFDQDSVPAPDLASALAAVHAAVPRCAAVGANWTDAARPDEPSRHLQRHPTWRSAFTRTASERDLTAVLCVITSGTMFDLAVWRALGGFAEDLQLDLVDSEYCLRARAAGFEIAVAAAGKLEHRRGAKRAVRRFGRTWWPAFMPPARLRLLFHNRMLVGRKFGLRFPPWAAFECAFALKILTEICLCEDRTAAKLGACVRGTWEGLLGRPPPPLSSL